MNLLWASILVTSFSLVIFHLFKEYRQFINAYQKLTTVAALTLEGDSSLRWNISGTPIPHCITFAYAKNLLDPKYLQSLEEDGVRARNVNSTVQKFLEAWGNTETEKKFMGIMKNDIPLNYSVRFLSDEDCIRLINETEPRLFIPFMVEDKSSYKADLCRAVALWHTGGYHLDVDVMVHEVPSLPPQTEFSTILEENHIWFHQAFVAVAPKHPVMNLTMQVMVDFYEGRQQALQHHASIGSWSMREAYTRWIKDFPLKADSVYFLETTLLTNQPSLLPEVNKLKDFGISNYGIVDFKINKLFLSMRLRHERRPYNFESGHYNEKELPFIATIHDEVFTKPEDFPPTPNFYETLERNNCLPDNDCTACFHIKTTATCREDSCASKCPCYCQALCKEPVEPKFVSKHLYVTPPLYRRDPNRLIPRIVHQTWFEKLTSEKYPNLSRLVESFRQSGWEYKFYTDEDAAKFLSTHFPLEVREAYDALESGAYKADLFRYCILLIYGGVYADVDVMLESSLDYSVPPDVGFMVPTDEPGEPVDRRMCFWNGFMAAAPGHPFLIQAIEMVVNQVRNRFTILDLDATFCPDPELSIVHLWDTLFPSGPCLLGSAVNHVLGRHPQTSFLAEEIIVEPAILDIENDYNNINTKDEFPDKKKGTRPSWRNIPGRTIILSQNKNDMGAQRFTRKDSNLIVGATDLPGSNCQSIIIKNLQQGGGGDNNVKHYSEVHAWTGIYGLEGVYTDKNKANEDVRFYLVS